MMIASKLLTSRVTLAGALLAIIAAGGLRAFRASRDKKAAIPPPSTVKQDPQQLDKMLDGALKDSMAASDPPSMVQPDVKLR